MFLKSSSEDRCSGARNWTGSILKGTVTWSRRAVGSSPPPRQELECEVSFVERFIFRVLELSLPSVGRVSRCLFSSASREAGEVAGSLDSFSVLEKCFTASRNRDITPGHSVELFLFLYLNASKVGSVSEKASDV